MISAVVAGNLGKDAEVKSVGGQDVCSFSVASTTKVKGEDSTTWVRCSMWGSRGAKLAEYLTRGKAVCVSGGLTTREYEGKTYVELRVDDVKLMGGNKESGGGSSGGSGRGGNSRGGKQSPPPSSGQSGGGGYDDHDYSGDDDDIPFIANVSSDSRERWFRF
ncbi:MAG TPA: single-stranded DNA-binding protein [Polyangiaceae bacterium]|nr:single-stranded DNA-binding protein [Polyangiaceae bacterium]